MLPAEDQRAVLRANDRRSADGRAYTIPAPALYPFQWNWDSAFAALGWAALGEWDRAWSELASLAAAAADDGRIPHIAFWSDSDGYFPGPAVWQCPGSGVRPPISGLTQPPVATSVVRLLAQHDPDRERARRHGAALIGVLAAWSDWFARGRDAGVLDAALPGVVVCTHPWESGMDNSPVWDDPLGRVAITPGVAALRRDLNGNNAAERPTHDDYGRYVTLLEDARAVDYRGAQVLSSSNFAVADPALTAVALRAEGDLVWLLDELGPGDDAAASMRNRLVDRMRRRGEGLSALYHDGWWYAHDLLSGRRIERRSVAGALAVWATTYVDDLVPSSGEVSASAQGASSALDALVATVSNWVDTCGVLPTYDPHDERFDPRRYWRGPSWANLSWMVASGLVASGHGALGERVWGPWNNAPACEYLDAHSGGRLGAGQFTWTAALQLWVSRYGL